MRKITVLIFAVIIVALASSSVTAQTDFERSQTLTNIQAKESPTAQNRKPSAGQTPMPRGRRYSSLRCEAGHWVDFVSNGGRIVILEDSSIWEVDTVDAINSALWLPTTGIVACGDKLINTEDNETVSARRIR